METPLRPRGFARAVSIIGLGIVATGAGSVGCEPVSVDSGHFWKGVEAGVPDSRSGTGGMGATEGARDGAGDGSGGATATPASPNPGATTGSGGNGATPGGSGGGPQNGGSGGASAGTGGGGGSGETGGRTGTGGRPATAGSGGAVGTGGSSGVLTGSLKVAVTTKAAGGRYQPDNVGAIWIADADTKFVKSLYVWAAQRRRNLTRWVSATTAAGLANNLVDATTGATQRAHGVRNATWNGTDAAKMPVPDGAYKVCFELADGSSAYQCVDFMKTRAPQTLMPADNTSFTQRKIEYTP